MVEVGEVGGPQEVGLMGTVGVGKVAMVVVMVFVGFVAALDGEESSQVVCRHGSRGNTELITQCRSDVMFPAIISLGVNILP